tara:strand:- start:76 stop:951 length:876 start_codon:yes stop_codon:yes gene_type:complete
MTKRYKIEEMLLVKNTAKLPEETVRLIEELANTVGANTYSKTPVFQKQKRDNKRKDFVDTSNFKKTDFNKEGVDKNINELRSLLNKLTNTNYEKIKPKLEEHIEFIINSSDQEEIKKIGNFIFETASSNKFYSEVYAILYSEIITKHSILKDILNDSIDTYLVLFENIELVDSNVDYDKFCKNNVLNDKRKSISLFITNLMKQNVLDMDVVTNMIYKLDTLMETNVDKADNKKIVEEIVENVFIIVTNMGSCEANIKEKISGNLTKYNGKMGFSNKSKFKYMDIIDFIKDN